MTNYFNKLAIVLIQVFVTGSSFSSRALAGESEKQSHFDITNGITISVAAGTALAFNQYSHRQKLEAIERTKVNHSQVVKGTGASLGNRSGQTLVDVILSGTRNGDIVTLDYTPGTIEELRHAVNGLHDAEKAWAKRMIQLSKDLAKIDRRRTVALHQLAELPLKEESRDARDRAQARLVEARKEFETVKQAELDAQARMHNARAFHAAELRNLQVSERTGKLSTTIVKLDLPVDENIRGKLTAFVDRVSKDQLPKESKAKIPHIRISRVNMPDLQGSMKLLKEARRGAWVAGLGFAVAIEEVFAGYLADEVRQQIQPSNVVEPRNTRTAR